MNPLLQRQPQARRTARALLGGTHEAVADSARAALAHADDVMATPLAELHESSGLACARRCSHCCSLDVAATFPEVAHLAAFIEATFSASDQGALRERLAGRVAEDAARPATGSLQSGRSCPLLVNQLCSAYEARPLACRGWNSQDVGPCIQAAARPDDVHLIPVHRILRDTAHVISQGIQDGVRESGLDDDALDLPRALHALLQDREGLTQLWLDGRRLPPTLRSRASGSKPLRRVSG